MRRLVIIIASLVLLAGLAFFLFESRGRVANQDYYARTFPDPKPAYDFKLTDQNGKPFQLDQLRGKLVLLTFGFTHCPNICPTILGNLAAVDRALPADARARTQIVFVSVDPARDTPEALRDYVPAFNESFIGLTGSAAQIKETAKAYGVVYEKQFQPSKVAANYYTINHSTYLYVIDAKGKWIALYDYDQLTDIKKIAHDVERFLASG